MRTFVRSLLIEKALFFFVIAFFSYAFFYMRVSTRLIFYSVPFFLHMPYSIKRKKKLYLLNDETNFFVVGQTLRLHTHSYFLLFDNRGK